MVRFFWTFLLAVGLFAERIEVIYHIGMLNNWEEVVEEQLEKLERSGLGEAADHITVTAVGPRSYFAKLGKLFKSFPKKVTLIHAGRDLALYEFPGIEQVIRIGETWPDAKILYMHNKGVTHFGKATEESASLWRRYMEYFTIERWKDCVEALDAYDICGVEWFWNEKFPPHFRGNFWWARGEYVQRCHLNRNDRFDCEFFIGTGQNPLMKCFHQSGHDLYYYSYFEENYR
jgi:hypothetical protein